MEVRFNLVVGTLDLSTSPSSRAWRPNPVSVFRRSPHGSRDATADAPGHAGLTSGHGNSRSVAGAVGHWMEEAAKIKNAVGAGILPGADAKGRQDHEASRTRANSTARVRRM